MHDDHQDQHNQPARHGHMPSKADLSSPGRLEPLGEGYDELDRTLDAAVTAEARELLSSPSPSGLTDRLFEASMLALAEHQTPHRFVPEADHRRPSHALQRLALAACMGFAVLGAWWLVTTGDRIESTQAPMVVVGAAAEIVLPQDANSMNPEAEWAMLASTRGNQELDQLVALVATRDVGFADVTGDLTAILDAMQNPHLQAFDLEWRR